VSDPKPDLASPLAWRAELRERLHECTVVASLPEATTAAANVISLVKRFGFAIIESTPCAINPAAIRARSDELREFGSAIGSPLVQSPRRELVEDVKDFSDVETGDDRGYRSGGELLPHSDPPTLILLHCLRPAKEGGETAIVSVAAIVERMRALRPHLVDELFTHLPDWRVAGQYGLPETGPADPRPVLAEHNGVVSCALYRPFIEKGAEASGQPLTPVQIAALDLFEKCSMDDDLTLRFTLNPGQTILLHNRSVLHARTDYVDWPELHRRRHLLRVWIDAPDAFPVHPEHCLGDFFAPRG
jgi:alpha-ketoglutarate-dependent taurine dioxygenase